MSVQLLQIVNFSFSLLTKARNFVHISVLASEFAFPFIMKNAYYTGSLLVLYLCN